MYSIVSSLLLVIDDLVNLFIWADIVLSPLRCFFFFHLVRCFVFLIVLLRVITEVTVFYYYQGRNLRGYGGRATHPPPQLPISQGTEEVCRAKLLSVNLSAFFFGCHEKRQPPQGILHNGRAVYPFTPPQPKGASFAPDYYRNIFTGT